MKFSVAPCDGGLRFVRAPILDGGRTGSRGPRLVLLLLDRS